MEFRGILSYLCLIGLGIIIYTQFDPWPGAAASRHTPIKMETSVIMTTSPAISGDKVSFKIKVTHTPASVVKSVDAVLKVRLPVFLEYTSHNTGTGIVPTSFDKTTHTLEFKFAELRLNKKIDLTLKVDADPYFLYEDHDVHSLSPIIDYWYYDETGPCDRPSSMYNAKHLQRRIKFELQAGTAYGVRIESSLGSALQDDQYFASSYVTGSGAKLAAFSEPGAWRPFDLTDRNQFIQFDFGRLMRVTKIGTRGVETPNTAFVRSYHLYHSKNLFDWSYYREDKEIKEFDANTNGKDVKVTRLDIPVTARYIRIVPRSWKRHTALKVQFYGATVHPTAELADFCPIFDFENGLKGWKKTGDAFKNQPTLGDNLKYRTGQPANIEGNAWIATAENRPLQHVPGTEQGDAPQGTLTSPKFLIGARKLYFLIGGTADSSKARVELLVDGAVVRTASPAGENLTEHEWEVGDWFQQEVRIRLVDDATDGHLSFDALRMSCHLDGDATDISPPPRSVLLNPATHTFYVCDSSHIRHKSQARCRVTGSGTNAWTDLPDILGILGVDKSNDHLYAVSSDWYVVERSSHVTGSWRYITRDQWNETRLYPTMELVTGIAPYSYNKVEDEVFVTLNETSGEAWRASRKRISFQGVGQEWVDIASWEIPPEPLADPCLSYPCEHKSECSMVDVENYTCACLPGYTGQNCEEDIDYCVEHECENGARCIDSKTQYYCKCINGFTGSKCETRLSPCRNDPCENGGTCVNQGDGTFTCTCPNGYRGERCDVVFDKCGWTDCHNGGRCVHESPTTASCVCPDGFTGANCQNKESQDGFTVIDSKDTTLVNNYRVYKVAIPSDGRSIETNWCQEYIKLCRSQHRRPAGFGQSYNHLAGPRACRDQYFAQMDTADELGSSPNEKVAEIARGVGYTEATSTNSFAFNECDFDKCSSELPDTGCDKALGCISKAVPDLQAYTVCLTHSAHNFNEYHQGWVHEPDSGLNLLILAMKPEYYSLQATWCHDFQELCATYGLRPVGERRGLCQKDYNAFNYPNIGLSKIGVLKKLVYSANREMNMLDCSHCDNYIYNSDDALYHMRYTDYTYSTACSAVHGTAFRVLDQKKAIVDQSDYLAIKVQVPEDGKSTGENWCKDYQTLCESYGRKPIGCDEYCVFTYGAPIQTLTPECPMSKATIVSIVNQAGFNAADDTNSFALHDCSECSSEISTSACNDDDIFCVDESKNPHRILYTLCVFKDTVIEEIEVRDVVYNSKPFRVIYSKFPTDGLSGTFGLANWCEEYEELCVRNDALPTGCGLSYAADPAYSNCATKYSSDMSDNILPCGSSPQAVASAAGFWNSPSSYNTFAFHQCSDEQCATQLTYDCAENCTCHPSLSCVSNSITTHNPHGYAVCAKHREHAFEVLATYTATFAGDDVIVIKARLPSHGLAVQKDWCEDYRRLCADYDGFRPVACGGASTSQPGYESCRHRYGAVMSPGDEYGCPPANKVAEIARSFGFTEAGSHNSFGLTNCSKVCLKKLQQDVTFIDPTVADGEVYTVCAGSNSNFKVLNTEDTTFNGANYLFIEAKVPTDFLSKHVTWCTDYERMCESYGLRPVRHYNFEGVTSHAVCARLHKAVNPLNREASERETIRSLGLRLGYSRANHPNTFSLHAYCDTNCFNDMIKAADMTNPSMYSLTPSYIENNDYLVYTVCSSSDSNFRVMSTKSVEHNGHSYLVVMTALPSNRVSKYGSWCTDYERLCKTYRMRPTGCGLSYQYSGAHRACVDKYQSAMAHNDALGCNSTDTLVQVIQSAGFPSANVNNTFMFNTCAGSCPRKLISGCPEALSCLSNKHDVVYTVCTDSSSAFSVNLVDHVRFRDTPLILISTSQTGTVKSKNANWCRDYDRLCGSFAARPVGCDLSNSNKYKKCTTDYGALPFSDDLMGCDGTGHDPIFNIIRHWRPALTEGNNIRFAQCSDGYCSEDLVASNCHKSLYCALSNAYVVYAVCARHSNNFDIASTKTTSYQDFTKVLVIKATVPASGASLYDTWCEDYEDMCAFHGMRALSCPLLCADDPQQGAYLECQKTYHGLPITLDTLSCPFSEIVAKIAQDAGFNDATSANSFALSHCHTCSKYLHTAKNGTKHHMSLSTACPSGFNCSRLITATDHVYTACVNLPKVSGFGVKESKRVYHNGRHYMAFIVAVPGDGISPVGDWCTDYRKLCSSVGMRPIACGDSYARLQSYRECRIKYNAAMLRGYSCSPMGSLINVMKAVKYPEDRYRVFGMHDCQFCGAQFLYSEALKSSEYRGQMYTACVNSDSAFEVLETRNTTIDNKEFLAVRALLPNDSMSGHENWCKDYEMVCQSYGKRPLTCASDAGGSCKYMFNALTSDTLNCAAQNVHMVAKNAGFPEASEDNTIVLRSCQVDDCLHHIPSEGGGAFGPVRSSSSEVYLLCLNSNTAYTVLATSTYLRDSHEYLGLQVKVPPSLTSNGDSWCDDYTELCKEYGFRPITCNSGWCQRDPHFAYNIPNSHCPVTSSYFITSSSAPGPVNVDTNFAFTGESAATKCLKVAHAGNCTEDGRYPLSCYDNMVNNGEFTTQCYQPSKHTMFPILDYKSVKYTGRDYIVVRTNKQKGKSREANWCHDYKRLCTSFLNYRPVSCPVEQMSRKQRMVCARSYNAVSLENTDYGCPLNEFVAELAQKAGFTTATPQNSFAFHNCDGIYCKNVLPPGECNEALYCLNTRTPYQDLFTICAAADTRVHVTSTKSKVHRGRNYIVVNVYVSAYYKESVSKDWCQDYRRICESLYAWPVECYEPGTTATSYICRDSYGAARLPCGDPNIAHEIARAVGFASATSDNTVVMHTCDKCPRVLTAKCDNSLKCAKLSKQLYLVCYKPPKESGKLVWYQTKQITYGRRPYLLVQANVAHYYSSTDWRLDYINLCRLFDADAIACGRKDTDSSSSRRYCETGLSHVSISETNDLICPPYRSIAILARENGFWDAARTNSFALNLCGTSSYNSLPTSSCLNSVSCLSRQLHTGTLYGMCARPQVTSLQAFEVLDKKSMYSIYQNYIVLKVKVKPDGISVLDNWCYEYQHLCGHYDAFPTGCGTAKENVAAFETCRSTYRSFMAHSNILKCENSKIPSGVARKAGFPDATDKNTFVFSDCSKCSNTLESSKSLCHPALPCLQNKVWKGEAYTICIKPTSAFEVLGLKEITYENTKYSVVKAALPAGAAPGAVNDNWCQDYQKLCYMLGKFPVACNSGSIVKTTAKFGAVVVDNLPCPPADKVVEVARAAGYTEAKTGNAFAFTDLSSPVGCPQYLTKSFCPKSLSCLKAGVSRVVYTICTNPTNFEIVDTRVSRYEDHTFTVVSARLPESGQAVADSWCAEYTNLCAVFHERPVACPTIPSPQNSQTCSANYGAYILSDKYKCWRSNSEIYKIAEFVKFTKATMRNTISMSDCNIGKCQKTIHNGSECDPSLNCVNRHVPNREVFALCLKENSRSNFDVLATKEIVTNNIQYLAIKARVPVDAMSKHDTWCKDYEMLCSEHEMRPVRCSTQDYPSCIGLHNALIPAAGHLDCSNKEELVALLKGVWNEASAGNTFIYGACATRNQCRNKLSLAVCDSSLSCLEAPTASREVYTVCARSLATSFVYHEARASFHRGVQYLVIKISRRNNTLLSTNENWCYDVRDMCASFGKRALVYGHLSHNAPNIYNRQPCYTLYNGTSLSFDQNGNDVTTIRRNAGYYDGYAVLLRECQRCEKKMDDNYCPIYQCITAGYSHMLCL